MVQPIAPIYRTGLSITQPNLTRSLSHLISHADALTLPKQRKFRKVSSLNNLALLRVPEDRWGCKNPLLNEIITDIKTSLQFRERAREEIRIIVTECARIAQDEISSTECLGYVCFLCEYGYSHLLKAISEIPLSLMKANLKFAFDKALFELLKPVVDLENTHRKVNLQEAQRASIMMLPRLIAKAIVSCPSVCNAGIIARIKENFNGPLAFHKHLQYVLTELERDFQLRHKIRLIKKPRSIDAPANDIIRMTLCINPSEDIQDWHAQLTALSALLTDLRQGRVGSCFATFLAINQLNTNLPKVLDDFREILLSSSLTRHLKGKARLFPLLMEVGYHFRDKSFTVTQEGKLDNGSFLWESPGLIEACKYAGIADPKESILRSLPGLCRGLAEDDLLTLNSQQLMEAIIPRELPYRDHNLLKKSMLAFESQTNHLLLRVWEITIAHMAESDETGITTRLLMRSLIKIFYSIGADTLFLEEYASAFIRRCRFLYTPQLKLRLIDAEEHGYYGSFILFDTQDQSDAGYWMKIDSAPLFLQLIKEIIVSCRSLNTHAKDHLMELIDSPAFLVDLVELFGKKFDSKEFAWPWMNFSGNDPKRVYQNYHELAHLQQLTITGIANAEHLFHRIIDMMRKNTSKLKSHFYSQVRFNLPLFIDERHACRADLRSPFLLAALKDRRYPEEWVNEVYLGPLKSISKRHLSDEQRDEMMTFASAQVEVDSGLNLIELRTALLHRIPELDAQRLDGFIFNQILTDIERQQLLLFAIPFIDTNWEESGYHVHVGFLFNPGSGKIECWKIRSDMKKAAPMDQATWISDYVFIL